MVRYVTCPAALLFFCHNYHLTSQGVAPPPLPNVLKQDVQNLLTREEKKNSFWIISVTHTKIKA